MRRLAVLLAVALPGCQQSLFDATVAGRDGGGDAGAQADAGGGGGDGGAADCPEPCEGDPVADFDLTQGGENGRWLYLEDLGAENGSGYAELVTGTYQGVMGWVGAGGAPPALLPCPEGAQASVCQGAGGSLLLVPSAEGGNDPVLAFVPPDDGTYLLSGEFRVPEGAETGLSQKLLVSRNARHDLLHQQSFATSLTPESFSVEVEALGGDAVFLTLPPNASESPVPVAFDFSVTRATSGESSFPGACLFAATFDGDEPFVDRCGGATIEDLNDNIGPAGTSQEEDSVTGRYDQARLLAEGQFLRSTGGALDYSGDFTVQFWFKLVEPQPFSDPTPYADWNCAANGGVASFFDHDSAFTEFCYMWDDQNGPYDCMENPGPSGCVTFDHPTDGEWHFYRISRELGGMLRICVDGAQVGSDGSPADFDMTGNKAPHLGRNVTYNPAYTDGSIDDVRVFSRALPCPTP